MLKIRKAHKTHTCLICTNKIEIKKKYMQLSKKQGDGSYLNGAICENCAEKLISSKIEEDN